jgi:hypothetical protein
MAALGVVFVARRLRNPAIRVVAYSAAVGLVAAVFAALMLFTGAAQVGWPFVWAIGLAPLRVIGHATPASGFAIALGFGLLCNAVTVVATFVLGLRAGLSTRIAFAGAGLVAAWPFLSLLVGSRAASNGTWQIWLGLSLYTEPLSTALVTVALALVVGRRSTARHDAIAGTLLGAATLVRLSNVLLVGCVVASLLVWRGRRTAATAAAAAAAWAPAVIAYWPKGYPKLKPPVFPAHPFALSYASNAWTESMLWRPALLAVVVPIALVGAFRVAPLARATLVAAIFVTAAFYIFYELTPIHPRFLFVVVPALMTLWAAGAATIADRVAGR